MRVSKILRLRSIATAAVVLLPACDGEQPLEMNGEGQPMTREEAVALARQAFVDSLAADRFVLALTPPDPLSAGTEIHEIFGPPDAAPQLTVQSPSYFVFVDPVPTSGYPHPVYYLLVDAETGDVEVEYALFPPSIAGVPHYASFNERTTSPDRFEPVDASTALKPVVPMDLEFEEGEPVGMVSATALIREIGPPPPPLNAELANGGTAVAVLVDGGSEDEEWGHESADAMEITLGLLGFDEIVRVDAAEDDLTTAVDRIRTATQDLGANDKFLLFYAGHSWIDDRNGDDVPDGPGSEIAYGLGGANQEGWFLTPARNQGRESLATLLTEIHAENINVILDTCSAGSLAFQIRRFQAVRRNLPEGVTINIYAGSAANRNCFFGVTQLDVPFTDKRLLFDQEPGDYTLLLTAQLEEAIANGEVDTNGDGEVDLEELEATFHRAHDAAREDLPAQMPPPVTTFSISQPPTVVIEGPANGATFESGVTISLSGSASDSEEGPITNAAQFRWESSIDGFLGFSSALERNNLTVGTHTITLTVTDGDGNEGSTSVQITVGVGGVPQIEIQSPADGDVFPAGDPITFEGTATDPEDGEITNPVQLFWISSLDGDIGTGTSETRTGLSVGIHVITFEARDSDDNVVTANISITVTSGQPTPVIEQPADGSTFQADDRIAFQGTASDREDGTIAGQNLVWTSDLDGQIGTGSTFVLDGSALSEGTHTITLTATDADGNSRSTSVTIVREEGRPEVLIDRPADGSVFGEGDEIAFFGFATDAEDGNLPDDAKVWTSSIDGEIGRGTVVLRTDLSVGTHTITFTGTDSDGNASSDTITVTVVEGDPTSRVGFLGRAPGESFLNLFSVPVAGGEITQITQGDTDIQEPVASPTGRRIAFLRDNQIRTIAPGGGAERQISVAGELFVTIAWSPDGTRLAGFRYVANGGDREIVVFDVSGNQPAEIARFQPMDADHAAFRFLAWGPGDVLVWPCHALAQGTRAEGFVCRVNPDGTGFARLPTGFADLGSSSLGNTVMSPDGGLVAFHWQGLFFTDNNVYVTPADGAGAPRNLTAEFTVQRGPLGGLTLEDVRPPVAWSQNGSTVLFRCTQNNGRFTESDGGICGVPPTGDGNDVQLLLGHNGFRIEHFVQTPDGSGVVAAGTIGGVPQVFHVTWGGAVTPLTSAFAGEVTTANVVIVDPQ